MNDNTTSCGHAGCAGDQIEILKERLVRHD